MSFIDSFKEQGCNVNALLAVVDTSSGKFLCFTRLEDDQFCLCASDGDDVWRLELTEQSLDSYKEVARLNTEAYINKFRNSFKENEVDISQDAGKLSMTLGKGSKPLEFSLYECTARMKRKELQYILFRMAESTVSLQSKLDKAESTIETLKQQKGSSIASSGFDSGDAKKKSQTKTAPKPAGMSVLNPGMRKRKAAKGVEFD